MIVVSVEGGINTNFTIRNDIRIQSLHKTFRSTFLKKMRQKSRTLNHLWILCQSSELENNEMFLH